MTIFIPILPVEHNRSFKLRTMRVKVNVGAPDTWIPALPQSLKHEFSMDELEQMKQQFCDFDESGDGSIAASELTVLMKSMGITVALEEVQELIDKVDDNRSGELEYPEFVRLMSEFRRGNGDKLAVFIQYSKLALTIRHELEDLLVNPTQYTRPFAVKENAWEWNLLVQGPRDTPYEGGIFHFHLGFSHEYPYAAPSLTCRTRIYHPNFVPLLNGTMALCGFLERWQPEWRVRGLLERLEQILTEPDVDLMNAFYDDSLRQLGGNSDGSASISMASPSARRMRHPREITLECIDTFVGDPGKFRSLAEQLTANCAMIKPRLG